MVVPMVLSYEPGFTHRGVVVFIVFLAAYLSRHEPIDLLVSAARWSLVVMLALSLGVAGISPDLALEANYAGTLPGLTSRFWGLAFHANGMGALAFLLILLQYLQPSSRRWLNRGIHLLGLLVLVLAQSKTVWLLSIVGFSILGTYRFAMAPNGGLRMGFVAAVFLVVGVFFACLPYLDKGPLAEWYESSPLASNVTTLTGRTAIWAAAMDAWRESPLFGYGLDAWSVQRRFQLGLPAAVHAHNQLMQALSTAGLIGALSLLYFFAVLSLAAWRAMSRTRGVSFALFAFIAIRCVSEVPLEVGRILSNDVLALLLLFMIVINQPHTTEAASGQVAR
jgi:O-antigen ligase